MPDQEEINNVKNALADLDKQIGQIQNALDSPDTPADEVDPLGAELIKLQAKRSALAETLIDLQAAATEVSPLGAAAPAPGGKVSGAGGS
jgi:peptidoglycan hydrolase CwlO-like protein